MFINFKTGKVGQTECKLLKYRLKNRFARITLSRAWQEQHCGIFVVFVALQWIIFGVLLVPDWSFYPPICGEFKFHRGIWGGYSLNGDFYLDVGDIGYDLGRMRVLHLATLKLF